MSEASGTGPAAADLERALLERRANRMDLVARWADDLAHEIKNPLHAMVINLELVKRRAAGGEAEPVIHRAEVVEAELHRVHALVESLLRLVRPWPAHEAADVQQVFDHLLPVIRARTRIRKVDFDHAAGAGRVRIPPGDLAQVLLNLIDNAIDATPAGGALRTRCTSEGEAVRIAVTDSGSGPPPDLPDYGGSTSSPARPRPRPRAGRAGLGLVVSARLIHGAGGQLEIRGSEPGPGTTALLTFDPSASA